MREEERHEVLLRQAWAAVMVAQCDYFQSVSGLGLSRMRKRRREYDDLAIAIALRRSGGVP
jgi:hypothetical protein